MPRKLTRRMKEKQNPAGPTAVSKYARNHPQARKMTIEYALELIEDGHSVYAEVRAQEVCAVFGAKSITGHVMKSDPPGTFKGLTLAPGAEGTRLVTALGLGAHICAHLGVTPQSAFGRGSQGRFNAMAIRDALAAESQEGPK